MIITAELSGRGHYGVCSALDRSEAPELTERIEGLTPEAKKRFGSWTKPDFHLDPWGRTGIDDSLFCLDTTNKDKQIRLGWVPYKIELALRSLQLLEMCCPLMEQRKSRESRLPTEAILEVNVGKLDRGWNVKANFGEPIWKIIEDERFSADLLPVVKLRLQQFWEDRTGFDYRHSMSNTFSRGRYLQIYHPVGNGLWIEGHPNETGEFQLIDHNTDNSEQAFAHIYALCVVLDECRKEIERKNRRKSMAARYDPIV